MVGSVSFKYAIPQWIIQMYFMNKYICDVNWLSKY